MLSTYLYQEGKPLQTDLSRAEMLSALGRRDCLLWVDLEDTNDFESECLVEIFNFHPLAVEDCLSEHSEPKVDDYGDYFFLVMHAAGMVRDEEREVDELNQRELNIFFGKNYVVTFHKTPIGTIQQIREGLIKKPDRFMSCGADMLLHAILDRLVDNYQPVMHQYDKKIEQLEEQTFKNPPADYLSTVTQFKTDLFTLKRIMQPQRELINSLLREASDFINADHRMYFRDIYDHLDRVSGMAEGFHETLSSLLQAYFAYTSHKVNEVMKHLTVLATLAMPAIIIASIYGMNFRYMPGLGSNDGYLLSIAASVGISAGMLLWMKLKKWI